MTGMKLIDKDDPQYFEVSSDKLYDRHIYRLYSTDGKYMDFEDYDLLRSVWFQTASQFLSHVEVIDKRKQPKGF